MPRCPACCGEMSIKKIEWFENMTIACDECDIVVADGIILKVVGNKVFSIENRPLLLMGVLRETI